MTGRGAWPTNGLGGTLDYKGTNPGPYYRLPVDDDQYIGLKEPTNANERAVRGAVRAYQRALNRRLNLDLRVDGVYGPRVADAVNVFQINAGTNAWGGIGPDTSKLLLYPDLRRVVNVLRQENPDFSVIGPGIVCGLIKHESTWDAGAVGYFDDSDVGLAQINATAHPDLTEEVRLQPITSFRFVFDYLKTAMAHPDIPTIDDAIASYNLGIGGARRWISKGRPEWYTPLGSNTTRNVWYYIINIKSGCST